MRHMLIAWDHKSEEYAREEGYKKPHKYFDF
jgi:hypothetical protein